VGTTEHAAPDPIGPVVERMREIEASLVAGDGVARFNHLYLAVTLAVRERVATPEFEDPAFVAQLDVVFAGRYFAAIAADRAGGQPSSAWRPLFEARGRTDVAAIQFALAGMNAHINFDFCQALDEVARDSGRPLRDDSPQHRDFERVNTLLAAVEAQVKGEYDTGLVGVADAALGRINDVVASWSITRARDAAWTHAQTLAELSRIPTLSGDYLDALGGLVELSSRGLLVPTL
jgi:hypothetical protein